MFTWIWWRVKSLWPLKKEADSCQYGQDFSFRVASGILGSNNTRHTNGWWDWWEHGEASRLKFQARVISVLFLLNFSNFACETRDRELWNFLEHLVFFTDSSPAGPRRLVRAKLTRTYHCNVQETRGSLSFVKLCSLFSSSLLLKTENTRPLAPEMNFFIAAVHLAWTTFIRGVRSLQSHWSRMVFDHHALPRSPKMLYFCLHTQENRG